MEPSYNIARSVAVRKMLQESCYKAFAYATTKLAHGGDVGKERKSLRRRGLYSSRNKPGHYGNRRPIQLAEFHERQVSLGRQRSQAVPVARAAQRDCLRKVTVSGAHVKRSTELLLSRRRRLGSAALLPHRRREGQPDRN
jgi:hypothetical protein